MKAKAKGTRREHRCMRILESMNYRCIRSSASLTEFDVIAFNGVELKLIQVKSNRWPSPAEREAMGMVAVPKCASVECWRFDDRKRKPLLKKLDEF